MEKLYTIKELILAARDEYLKQLPALDQLSELVVPISGKADRIEFYLTGGLYGSTLNYDVVKKITKLDELLKRTDKKILSSYVYSPYVATPFLHSNITKFESIREKMMKEAFLREFGTAKEFKVNRSRYLLQGDVEEIRLVQSRDKFNPEREITYKYDDQLLMSEDTNIADAMNMLNVSIPEGVLSDYHKELIEKNVKDKFALRVVDYRKKDEVKSQKGVIVLAKRK